MKSKFAMEFISRVGKVGKRWGLGKPAGKIWGALAYSKKPLTQKEIAESCNYSLGLVSRSLRILKNFNIATAASRRGKERLYRTVSSFSDSFNKMVSKFRKEEMKRLFSLLNEKFEEKKKAAGQKLSTITLARD